MEFSREVTVRLYDTDAAGFLFFGAQFRLAHEVFEEFAASLGFPLASILAERDVLYPVVHAEADYAAPLRAGQRVTVRAAVTRIGEKSFALRYRMLLPDGREAGSVELVHAAMDAAGGPTSLPAPLRLALERFRDAAPPAAP